MLVRGRCTVVGVFAVALVVGVVFVGNASGQNAKDCAADKTCTGDPKKTATTTLTTIEPKKATMTTTVDPKKATTMTMTTLDPKKGTTTTTEDPRKTTTTTTTTMDPKKATTAKNTVRTQVVTSSGSGSDGVLRHYNISGKDSDNKSADLKEIVVLDVPVTADADKNVSSSGNASISVPNAIGVKPDANKAMETTLPTNVTVTVTSKVTTTATTPANNSITSTPNFTTESTGVSRPNTGVQVVRFINYIYCDCDLIYFSCDINCCCDGDCTNHDLKTFTMCSDQVKSSAIKPESILFDSPLFCVVIDNVPSDYFYPERDAIQSETQIEAALRNRDVFTWHDENGGRSTPLPSRMDSVFNSYDLTYKSSRWMYTIVPKVNSSETKTFSLKNSALNSLCSVEQPVEYLMATNTSCQLFVPVLKDVCNNDSSLSFKHYFSEKGIFKVVQPIYSSAQKTEKFGLVAVQATARHLCVSATGTTHDCRDDDHDPSRPRQHHPVYVDGVCWRAVDAVEYRVTHNGTGGVRKLDVHFYHRDVTDPGRPVHLGQTFRVRFGWAAAAAVGAREPYARSGKPGYATGSPVLVTGGDAAVPAGGRRPRPMDLPEPDAYGMCDRAGPTPGGHRSRRRPVNFLENVEVRCRVAVRPPPPRQRSARADESAGVTFADFCHRLQNETIAVLGEFEGILVASLGDPDVTKWIPTVVAKPPAPPVPPADDSTCPSVIDGVRVLVLYAHVGTSDRPQATVLGVSVNYTASATRLAGAAVVPVRASVVFEDLTRPPVRAFAEPPTYEFRLPEDFYYPFWSTDSSAVAGSGSGPGVASATAAAKARWSVVLSLVATCIAHGSH